MGAPHLPLIKRRGEGGEGGIYQVEGEQGVGNMLLLYVTIYVYCVLGMRWLMSSGDLQVLPHSGTAIVRPECGLGMEIA
jgi:hypothetical protein